MPDRRRQRAERRGRSAEARAALMLRLKGYRIIARRWRSRFGEIDLIVRRGRIVAFVEVKARATKSDAIESVTPRQRRRIVAAAECWLATSDAPADIDCRFDIVVVTPYQWPDHIPGAFLADD